MQPGECSRRRRASAYHYRLGLGVVIVIAGVIWRIRGPVGQVAIDNYLAPDVRVGDLLILPFVATGFLLISSRPGVRPIDRTVGTGLLLAAGMWLVTKHPLAGPVIWSGPGQHGLHVGDFLAAFPVLIGLQILIRSRVPPRRDAAGCRR